MKEVLKRSESKELVLIQSLNKRLVFSNEEKQYFYYLRKGDQGEKYWADVLNRLSNDVLILHDLTLNHKQTVFQIDTVCIFQKVVLSFEVKNYEGDFQLKPNDLWISSSGAEIKSPMLQVRRSESMLRQLFQSLRLNLPIEYYLVFVHPEFMLYGAPSDQKIIFPPQINRFIKTLNQKDSSLSQDHYKLASQLISLNAKYIKSEPFIQYKYEQLKKGVWCKKCSKPLIPRYNCLYCSYCYIEYPIGGAILSYIEELLLLFPNIKITTNQIFDWCGEIISKKVIQKVLNSNFKKMGENRHSYYVKADCDSKKNF